MTRAKPPVAPEIIALVDKLAAELAKQFPHNPKKLLAKIFPPKRKPRKAA